MSFTVIIPLIPATCPMEHRHYSGEAGGGAPTPRSKSGCGSDTPRNRRNRMTRLIGHFKACPNPSCSVCPLKPSIPPTGTSIATSPSPESDDDEPISSCLRHNEHKSDADGTASTAARQRGQLEWEENHISMQSMWKLWPHSGRLRIFWPSSNSLRHTAQSHSSSSPSSPAVGEKSSTGRDLRMAGSIARLVDGDWSSPAKMKRRRRRLARRVARRRTCQRT